MVIVNLSDGLGNQLFQYAVSRSLAYRLKTKLKLFPGDLKVTLNPKNHSYYRLGDFNIKENFATPEEVARVKETGVIAPPFQNIRDATQDVFVWGHAFHSEEAFIDVADIIRREFTLKKPLHKISAAWKKKILTAESSVALHIRHGDYVDLVHIIGVIPLDYYRTCVAALKRVIPNFTVFVFSDDLDWVRENLKLDVPVEFVEDCESDNEEFYLMSLCKHTVIANSTFSWWAAWLNPNPDKKVFAPQPWARSGLWDNGIPATWTRIPVDYENVPVDSAPLLSIIVYVRNNAANLNFLFSGVFGQILRDFELILIDDGSTDGSEQICRQVSLDKKVTLVTARGRQMGLAKAWNRGLECAHGEYAIFLRGSDLLIANAVHTLCQIYSVQKADMICSVRYLQENPMGDINVGGMAGKRFVQRVDEQFKTLNAPYLFKSDDVRQKLMMTGAQAFNSLLGTKFFRRDFLEKNSLRFNENLTSGCELLFLVEAVTTSKEIMFLPGIFHIAPR